jgi:hypothetical protein
MNPGPVTTMHDDIAFSFVLGELFSVVILDVAFADGGDLGCEGLLVGVLDVQWVILLHHGLNFDRDLIIVLGKYLCMMLLIVISSDS